MPRPEASNVNFAAAQTVADLVVVKLDLSGQLCIFSPPTRTDVLADVAGWFGAPGA